MKKFSCFCGSKNFQQLQCESNINIDTVVEISKNNRRKFKTILIIVLVRKLLTGSLLFLSRYLITFLMSVSGFANRNK